MNDQTERSHALAEQWAEAFNSDIDKLITELYAPDCLFNGVEYGHDRMLRFERRVLTAAPQRSIRIAKTHAAGDVITIEGELLDPDRGAEWKLPFCAVLTWRDGKVVSDNTYAELSRWPGMS
jgi:predicted SnoaL-like aldol condensation-catalyzing enzyme